jgi:L-threonylcarbamoyladenylate synthase
MVKSLAAADAAPALARVLAAGGVAIIPHDTIYGIVGVAPDTEARISRIKRRDPGKPYLRLIADETWLPRLAAAQLPPALRPFWPGPLTIVLPALDGGTIAVRVPADAWLRDLLQAVNRPLASTSVNVEGEEPLGIVAEIVRRFEPEVDLIVAGSDRPQGAPSTLLDVTSRPYRILRQGVLVLPADLPGLT